MGKVFNSRKVGLNFLVSCQRRFIAIKKQTRLWLKSCRPYLAPKYWFFYLIAFATGFYLWGPAHGIEKVQKLRPFQMNGNPRVITIETLQREIDLLKKEIKKQQTASPDINTVKFNPENFSRPILGEKIQGFNWISTNNTWRLHTGIDIGAAPGSNVMAAAEGVVVEVFELPETGLVVAIDHGSGWRSIYANLGKVSVKKGDKVIKGMIIGASGSRSCVSEKPGFHFEIQHNRQPVDPENIIQGLKK